jgi:hypothetical protein
MLQAIYRPNSILNDQPSEELLLQGSLSMLDKGVHSLKIDVFLQFLFLYVESDTIAGSLQKEWDGLIGFPDVYNQRITLYNHPRSIYVMQ